LIVDLLGRQFKSRWGMDDVFGGKNILFGDLLRLDSENKDYEEIKETVKLIKVLEDKLDDYNLDFNSKTKLVFFDDAIDHILRISRILR
jgi:dynein heavy chain